MKGYGRFKIKEGEYLMDEIRFKEPRTFDDFLAEKYERMEQERIDALEEKYFGKEQENFMDKLVGAFYQMDPRMTIELAHVGARSLLSSCCPRVEIQDYYPRPLNISSLDLLLAESGDNKTMILETVRDTCKEFELLIMEDYSTEGLTNYFSKLKDEKQPLTGYENKPYGTMVIDEVSRVVIESQTKTHMAGVLEIISKLYDRRLPWKELVKESRRPQEPIDVSILAATVPSTATMFPIHLFKQGFASRFNWTYVEPRPYPEEDIPIYDFRHSIKVKQDLGLLSDKLRNLLDVCKNTKNYTINLEPSKEVEKVYNDYAREMHNTWLSELKTMPSRFHWQFYKRLAEMAIKEAGRFAIGRQIDIIINNKSFTGVKINVGDLKRGIQSMRVNEKHLREVISIKADSMSEDTGLIKPKTVTTMYWILLGLPNATATIGQWKTACKMEKSPSTFNKYKDDLINQGYVEYVDKDTITDPEERERLRVSTGNKIVRGIVKKK